MPKITVTFWDGTTKPAATREEAVQIVKTGLDWWRQEGDIILWLKQPKDTKLPSFAAVVNEFGEETDVNAIIREEER